MNELRPILGDKPTRAEERLLRSARLDVPPKAGKGRTLASLGLAAAMTTAAGTGGAAATAVGATAMVKWIALGAIGGTIAAGVAGELKPLARDAPPRHLLPQATPTATTVVPALPIDPPGEMDHASEGPASMPPVPAIAVARPLPTSPPTTAPLRPESTSDQAVVPPSGGRMLADEVNALEQARRAFAFGDAERALRELDAYDRRFAGGRLGPEATMLRIEALLAEEQVDRATQLGKALLAQDPHGLYAQRVRTLLARANR